MIPGDYIEKTRTGKSGKRITEKVVTSTTGEEYAIGKRLGAGGVAKVFKARRLRDKKECVFKEYVPTQENQKMHRAIRKNIQTLMKTPLTEEDGVTSLGPFVGPMDQDSLIELPASGGFGYIMELVDTKAFLPVPKLRRSDKFPDAAILCKACHNIAYLFRRLHFTGWCYKDINEGNIYINNQTGEIRIIDCDNISTQSVQTIQGTNGYMAPEVYDTCIPDTYTDYFSMAVLFYRILVGGYPMDGQKTHQYLMDHNLSISEAAPVIYGSMACFAFDARDRSNEIRNLTDPLNPNLYLAQCRQWDRLPDEIQALFQQTFSLGLPQAHRTRRATDRDWMKCFETLETNGLVTCTCGRKNFASSQGTCLYCGAPLPGGQELTTVVFQAKRDLAPACLDITARRKQLFPGKAIHRNLNEGWMKIQYNKSQNSLCALNLSRHTWLITESGVKTPCPPGQRVVLKKAMVITVLRRQLQLTVKDIR